MSNEVDAAELAERTGVNRVTAWRWLAGHARPSRLALARLATLGVVLQLPALRPRPRPKRRSKGRPAGRYRVNVKPSPKERGLPRLDEVAR